MRYLQHMPKESLTPHLAEFIQKQLATGRFQSEGDVIRAALELLEEESYSREASIAWLKQEIDRGVNSRPSEPITKEYWARLRAYLNDQQWPNDVG
jgi:putative addiction module CopG family antidote